MTRTAIRLGLAVLALALIAGCGKKGGPAAGNGTANIALFKGGYGIDFFEKAAWEYEAKKPGTKLKVWGNPRVWEQLRPLFINGNPPDLCYPGWGMDHWALVYENQIVPLDEYLDGKPWDGAGTWRDTFEPSLLKLCQYKGKTYMLPYFYSMQGWWYNPDLFAKHGWKVPQTWSELLALCPKIKAAGIAPITYQGKYPYYAVNGFLLPWAISAGGIEAVDAAQNLDPGAWKSPAMLQAARMIKELKDKGFFQDGCNGMSHTESQMEFVNGRAAMIPCGTWLHSEMGKQLPAGFRMQFMLPPVLDNGVGDPGNILIGIEPWMVPTQGKNRKTVVDFYRYLTSEAKAKQFIEEKGTLMAIRGTDSAKLPEYLTGPAKAFRESKTAWSVNYVQWYPEVGTATQNAMAALLTGEITPEEFCKRSDDAAKIAREDPKLPKHRIER